MGCRFHQLLLLLGVAGLVATGLSGCTTESLIMGRAVETLNQSAQAYLRQGNTSAAVARLEAARELTPQQPEVLHNLAVAYQKNQQFSLAISLYGQLAELRPEQTQAYQRSKALAYEQKGDRAYQEWQQRQNQPVQCQTAALDSPSPQQLADEATDAYQQAVVAYQQLLPALAAQEQAALTQHMDALQDVQERLTQAQAKAAA